MPLKAFARDQIWCAIVTLTLVWKAMLAFTNHQTHCWEHNCPRFRLFTVPTVIARTAERTSPIWTPPRCLEDEVRTIPAEYAVLA